MSAESDAGSEKQLSVVLCWHMHQPDYRGPKNADFQLPWVYLHGIKDYVDMAWHLEETPDAKAVVNFAPVLLEQIEDYVQQIDTWLERGKRIRDPLLAALAGPGLPLDDASRLQLVDACRKANAARLIDCFPAFRELIDLSGCLHGQPHFIGYLNDQFLVDLLVWYHLAWTGESVRENDTRVAGLQLKARNFSLGDRRQLVQLIGEQLASIVPRYRRLVEKGQVELSVTPYAHPIMPLLLDLDSALEAMPDAPMPDSETYPGGEERSRWHVRRGIATFKKHFGFKPQGCWPAEGSVSDGTLALLAEEGFAWAASGQQVLSNSLSAAGQDFPAGWTHRSYQAAAKDITTFFRDDGLSDLIGFTYGDWHADDAVGNLIEHLERIANDLADEDQAVVSLILDGENAWEYYPDNGKFFLGALYQRLASHPRLNLTTYREVLNNKAIQPLPLAHVVPGSWVYGSFSTWIGERDKNRGWDMLIEAKKVFDEVMTEGRLTRREINRAELQMATCEGSDWFWWFGDYNPGDTVSDFEQLFRAQLSHLYSILGEPAPDYLAHVFAQGHGDPSRGGVMRASQEK